LTDERVFIIGKGFFVGFYFDDYISKNDLHDAIDDIRFICLNVRRGFLKSLFVSVIIIYKNVRVKENIFKTFELFFIICQTRLNKVHLNYISTD